MSDCETLHATIHDNIKTLMATTARIEERGEQTLKQAIKTNGRVDALETQVEALKEVNALKAGALNVWKLIAQGSGGIFLVMLGAFLGFIWK